MSASLNGGAADAAGAKSKPKSNFIGAMGNFSVQYNMQVLSIALAFMKAHANSVLPSKPAPGSPGADYPEPEWAVKSLLAMVFTGSVVGMFCMGYIGDLLGRRIGMMLTLSIVVVGALGGGLLSWGDAGAVYGVITACRFLIGVGVGGIYPMAAATAAESTSSTEKSSERVGWAFFWQCPGAMAPYAVAWLLLAIIPSDTPNVTSLQFRILLALGAVPAAIVLAATYLSQRDAPAGADDDASSGKAAAPRSSPLAEVRAHPEYLRTLVGTGGTWFLFDVSYYGTAIFTPQILKGIFGAQDSLSDLCWQSLAVTALGIPGIIISIKLLQRWGVRGLNLWGFLLTAVAFAALAGLFMTSQDGLPQAKFGVFCFLTFALYFGPQVATYVAPALAYPPEVRATFHGLSAASGKLGAVTGTIIFSLANVSDPTVFTAIMWFLVAVNLAGAALTYFFLPDVREGGVIGGGKGVEDEDSLDGASLLRNAERGGY